MHDDETNTCRECSTMNGMTRSDNVVLIGKLVCRNPDELRTVQQHVAEHIRLSRAEPGCTRFSVEQTREPLVWSVNEVFTDSAAFDVHQRRVRNSDWGRATVAITRHFVVRQGERWLVKCTDVLGPDFHAAQLGEYAFPGPLRDQLVDAIRSGKKTATASLFEEHHRFEVPLPQVGDLEVVIDSYGKPACITRVTEVRTVRFGDVSDAHAVAEGEDYDTAEGWQDAHRGFWTDPEFLDYIGQPTVEINDDTVVVLVQTELIATF